MMVTAEYRAARRPVAEKDESWGIATVNGQESSQERLWAQRL